MKQALKESKIEIDNSIIVVYSNIALSITNRTTTQKNCKEKNMAA